MLANPKRQTITYYRHLDRRVPPEAFPYNQQFLTLSAAHNRHLLEVMKNHRYLKFSYLFPVSFVARLLSINTWPLSPSQETDVFRNKMVQKIVILIAV